MFYYPFESSVSVRVNWRRGGSRSTGFASARGNDRIHAACDLCVPRGTDIRAICDGEVLYSRHFYEGTWQLVVIHRHAGMQPFIVRYGETLAPGNGGISQARGASVTGGNVIAKVGQLSGGGSMLHFELYASADEHPSLSIAGRWNNATMNPSTYTDAQKQTIQRQGWHWRFQRRLDLADPTDFLQAIRDGRIPPQPSRLLSAGSGCCTWCEGMVASSRPSVVYSMEEEIVVGRNWTRERVERLARRHVQRRGMRYRMSNPLGTDAIPSPREAAMDEIIRSRPRTGAVIF